MTLPTLPRWATDLAALITEPASSKKDDGWEVSEKPPAHYMNWLFNQNYQAILWLVATLTLYPLRKWRAAELSTESDWHIMYDAAYAEWDSAFVAVGAFGFTTPGRALVSGNDDGDTWTARLTGATGAGIFYGVAHDGSALWCAVGDNGGATLVYTSATASAWTNRSAVHAALGDGLSCICYDATSGRFLAGLDSNLKVAYSTDPTSSAFTAVVTPNAAGSKISSVATDGNSTVVAASNSAGKLAYSTNAGTSWTAVATTTAISSMSNVIWDEVGQRFVFVGIRTSDSAKMAFESADGIVWSEHVCTDLGAVATLAVGSYGEFVVCDGTNLYGSTDLLYWYALPAPDGVGVTALAQNNSSTSKTDHFWVGFNSAFGTDNCAARTETNIR